MDVASFILIILALIAYTVFLFRTIVIYPKIRLEGTRVEKTVHALRIAFLFSFGTRVLVTL